MAEDWITTRQAEELSGYSGYHIRELIHSKRIKAQKFGEVWQVSKSSLLAYVRHAGTWGAKRGPKKEG